MNNNINTTKAAYGIKWIQAESGNTYLCQADAISHLENPTEEDLQKYCVEESQNPHNA